MGVSYEPLRQTLDVKNIKITNLCDDLNISSATRTKLNNDSDYVSLRTIERIGKYLNVPIEDLVKII